MGRKKLTEEQRKRKCKDCIHYEARGCLGGCTDYVCHVYGRFGWGIGWGGKRRSPDWSAHTCAKYDADPTHKPKPKRKPKVDPEAQFADF